MSPLTVPSPWPSGDGAAGGCHWRGEQGHAAAELADHAVDGPQAVRELDVVVLLAEPGDVPAGVADQPCGVQQRAARLLCMLLGILAPLGAQWHAAVDEQACVVDGSLGVLRVHGCGGAAHDRKEKRSFAGL